MDKELQRLYIMILKYGANPKIADKNDGEWDYIIINLEGKDKTFASVILNNWNYIAYNYRFFG